MALSSSGNRGRYGVEQKTENERSETVPEGVKYDAILRRTATGDFKPETVKPSESKPDKMPTEKMREIAKRTGITNPQLLYLMAKEEEEHSSSPPWHAVHLDEPRRIEPRRIEPEKPKPTRAELKEAQRHKEEQIVKEFRRAISEGKDLSEVAQEIEKKYGVKVEIRELKFEPKKEPETLDRVEAIAHGRLHPQEQRENKDVLEGVKETISKAEEELDRARLELRVIADQVDPVQRLGVGVVLLGAGVVKGALNTAGGIVHITDVGLKQGAWAAGEAAWEGMYSWFTSLPQRAWMALQGNPFIAGEIVGEFLAGEAVGRPIGRAVGAAVSEAMWQGFKAKMYFTAKVAEPIGQRLRLQAELAKLKVENLKWRATEPLYQKGILKARKEAVTERPLKDLLRDFYKDYRNIYLGISNLKGDLRPLPRSMIRQIEGRIAREETTGLTRAEAETILNIALGISNLKGEIRPLSRAQIREVEARNIEAVTERPLNYAELVYLQHLGELLGVKEEIKAERAQWIRSSEIVDISETGDWVTVETVYKGKKGRGYKVTWELSDTKVPEELWRKYEEWSFTSEPRVSRSSELFRLEQLEKPRDLSAELKRKWEVREREYRKLEQRGRSAKSGRQTLLLKDEVRTAKEIVRAEELEKLAREIELRNRELIKSWEVPFLFAQKHLYIERSRFERLEPVSFRVLYRSIEKTFSRFDQMFKHDQSEILGERYLERGKLETETALRTETVLRQELRELERLAQKLQQRQKQLQRQSGRTVIASQNPKLQYRLGREKKRKHRERRSGRSYKKVRHPVLRLEDALAKEVRKYARRIKKSKK